MRGWVRSLLAACLCAAGIWRAASAEILILKDGKRVPCRILAQSGSEITVRCAGGSERTLPLSDIAEIDTSVSPVEIYEAVGEISSVEGGGVAYYLGLWSLQAGAELQFDARNAFFVAARDPDWAGRAYYQLALLAQSPEEKRRYLRRSVAADPSFSPALEALQGLPELPRDIPRDALLAVADALNQLARGEASSAASKLAQVEALAGKAAETLSERLSQVTGYTLASLRAQLERGASEIGGQSTGPCKVCGGVGYLTCHVCQGKGVIPCSVCKGEGVIRVRVHSSRTGSRFDSQPCQACKGTGFKDCSFCLRRSEGASMESRTISVMEPCANCGGTGKVASAAGEKACPTCSGTGSVSKPLSVSASISASGVRRCPKCNADGHIPFQSTFKKLAAEQQGQLSGVAVARLAEFANLAKLAADGKADLRWRAGAKVPLYYAPPSFTEDTSDPLIFACGKWLPQSKAKAALARARSLQHKPRPVDLAQFAEWTSAREMEHLRRCAIPVGSADECLALVSLYGYALATGALSPLDRMQVYKTVFRPAGVKEQEMVCHWRQDAGSARGLEFVLLRRSAGWPVLEVTAAVVDGPGLDLGEVASAIASEPALRAVPVTLYYRVRSCSRSGQLREGGAEVRTSLGISVCAVVCGEEDRPLKVWTQPTQRLFRSGGPQVR